MFTFNLFKLHANFCSSPMYKSKYSLSNYYKPRIQMATTAFQYRLLKGSANSEF